MQRAPWLVMDAFVAQGGHEIMLSLMRVAPGDRHFHDCVPAALATLRTATLHPGAGAATAAATLPESRGGGGRRRRRARDARPPGDIREGHARQRFGGGHRRHAHHL